jgi:hypothetical protein
LELPTFWADDNYRLQRFVVEKTCELAIRLVQDVGTGIHDIDELTSSDVDGVDMLADTILRREWSMVSLARAEVAVELER